MLFSYTNRITHPFETLFYAASSRFASSFRVTQACTPTLHHDTNSSQFIKVQLIHSETHGNCILLIIRKKSRCCGSRPVAQFNFTHALLTRYHQHGHIRHPLPSYRSMQNISATPEPSVRRTLLPPSTCIRPPRLCNSSGPPRPG